ncbi:MAG: hypothetical protein PHI27_10525 [Eubacteriales bacterium]|nr:hypothetical protein [Eubacteriales bacterium]MDD3882675.1 hypothetical protein [Eubacteriales bacterium]MDD4512753.1 hypothetical protein [Eubacteriales bacterium]
MRTKGMRRIAALLLTAALLLLSTTAFAADGLQTRYTYTYDYWFDIRESPDAYRVKTVLNSTMLGLDKPMRSPQGMFVSGDYIYICDTGNNRLLEVKHENSEYKLVRVIDTVIGGTPENFSTPQDVFVDKAGNIYVCDTNNNRVVMMDKDCNFIKSYEKPTDETFDQNLSFLPSKLVVDVSGRVFALCKNVNKGLIKYEADGEFTGYIGANKVKFDMIDYIWKLFSTKEQRSKQESFVPTEYDNIYMDKKGFIYAVTATFAVEELLSDTANPIRKLNAIGNDILVKSNVRQPPIGELDWAEDADINGPSRLIDITVLDNETYVALDRVRGRLFGYDTRGIMFWAFGGSGNSDGYFLNAVAIDHMGNDLMVLDSIECSVTIFTPTEYCNLIYTANDQYLRGEYDASADTWREVLKLNGNYDQAFIGVGRSLLRQEKYGEAMEYFRYPRDWKNYGEAFRLYRKEWVEQNIGWIFALVAAAMVVPLVVGKVKKIKAEVNKS